MSTCSSRGQLEKCFKAFLISFSMSSSLTGARVYVSEGESFPLPHWQLLIESVELRNKISHSNQPQFGLCHISLSLSLASSTTPLVQIPFTQVNRSSRWKETHHTAQVIELPSVSLQIMFRGCIQSYKLGSLQGLLKSLR